MAVGEFEELLDMGWRETLRGMIFPFHCDHMGHVNNRWYGHFFDDASMSLWSAVGISEVGLRAKFDTSAVIARNEFDYRHELLNGQQFVVVSAFRRLGSKSVTFESRLYHDFTGTLCVTNISVAVFFDFTSRQSSPMPSSIRDLLESVVVKSAD
tara:strand:+ start:29 stop:490 length:462 start_codon:yes stop_codon:yes gene_type:complete